MRKGEKEKRRKKKMFSVFQFIPSFAEAPAVFQSFSLFSLSVQSSIMTGDEHYESKKRGKPL
jgi:hypothetical protein